MSLGMAKNSPCWGFVTWYAWAHRAALDGPHLPIGGVWLLERVPEAEAPDWGALAEGVEWVFARQLAGALALAGA